jgi:hypothetical protein
MNTENYQNITAPVNLGLLLMLALSGFSEKRWQASCFIPDSE